MRQRTRLHASDSNLCKSYNLHHFGATFGHCCNGLHDRCKSLRHHIICHGICCPALPRSLFPIEAHLVTRVSSATLPGCGAGGCYAIFGIMYELSDDLDSEDPFMATVFKYMPPMEKTQEEMAAGEVLNLTQLLPANQTYMTYEGSLTVPPCTEGMLWHVFLTPQKMSIAQYYKFLTVSPAQMRCACHPRPGMLHGMQAIPACMCRQAYSRPGGAAHSECHPST